MALTLGLDISTQSVSAVVLDVLQGASVAAASVNFGQDLPHYGAPQGFIPGGTEGEVHADPLMWLDGLELCLQQLRDSGVDLSRVSAVSGGAQQHGTVYLGAGWPEVLARLNPSRPLSEQLGPSLSRRTSPIWMDTSTATQCREIAQALGGDEVLCSRSGSIAIERFSGPQIRRFAQIDPGAYGRTRRIHLVSSFIASVMAGNDGPIDHGDGAGMNLLNLETLDWDPLLLAATAEGLGERLPTASPSQTVIGSVSDYFCERFGFAAGTPVVAFTGDNPSSLVGMGATDPGQMVISLGTSDTLFAPMAEPRTDPNGYGNVFGHPLGGYMSLVCVLNGSLAREKVRDRLGVDWRAFDIAGISTTPPGNAGRLMFPFFGPEITPRMSQAAPVLLGDPEFTSWRDGPAAVRACLEGQLINLWHHTRWMGVTAQTILLTGGASQSDGITQVVADVFSARVMRLSVPGSVALGGAIRAAGATGAEVQELAKAISARAVQQVIEPQGTSAEVYDDLKAAFARELKAHFGH